MAANIYDIKILADDERINILDPQEYFTVSSKDDPADKIVIQIIDVRESIPLENNPIVSLPDDPEIYRLIHEYNNLYNEFGIIVSNLQDIFTTEIINELLLISDNGIDNDIENISLFDKNSLQSLNNKLRYGIDTINEFIEKYESAAVKNIPAPNLELVSGDDSLYIDVLESLKDMTDNEYSIQNITNIINKLNNYEKLSNNEYSFFNQIIETTKDNIEYLKLKNGNDSEDENKQTKILLELTHINNYIEKNNLK